MKLTQQELLNQKVWEEAGIKLPSYDRLALMERTKIAPRWIHFGAGNIFRAFPAAVLQKLIEANQMDTGVIVAEGYDYEIIDQLFLPHDHLSLLVTLKSDGNVEKEVIGSITEALRVNPNESSDYNRLKEIFQADSLQMVSFTITEKGYRLTGADGALLPEIAADYQKGPDSATSYLGKICALLYRRYESGKKPIAFVSMDNCSHNGDKLFAAMDAFAKAWEIAGLVQPGFAAYVEDPKKVSFPWSMIDKITPRPDESVTKMLKDVGYEDAEATVTTKNTYIASFVNAEETQYLVIEDSFPNQRPPLEQAGILFTDRETVDRVEKMKVCTCLNPLHTTLAIFGCLFGYTKISEEMKDLDLVRLVEIIGYQEGLPVVVNPKILDPKEFIDTVLNVRIPNPFMPDTPQRIASDTSQKLAIRFGETIKEYDKAENLNVSDLVFIPLVFAGWLRYLLGTTDEGEEFIVSPDPMYQTLKEKLTGIKDCDETERQKILKDILSDRDIFGVDLYMVGLAKRVEDYFSRMLAGNGAVRKTLKEVLASETGIER